MGRQTVLLQPASQIFTSLVTVSSGLYVKGSVGTGFARTDAQIEIDNIYGGHTMFSIYNRDATDEGAISWGSVLSDGTTGQQQAATFVRFVNSVNTFNNYKTVWATHLVGSGADNVPLLLYSNNSVKLLAGDVSGTPWTTAATQNTVVITGTAQVANTAGTSYLQIQHNGTNGIITTSGGTFGFGVATTSAGMVFGAADGIAGYITIVDAAGNTRKLAYLA